MNEVEKGHGPVAAFELVFAQCWDLYFVSYRIGPACRRLLAAAAGLGSVTAERQWHELASFERAALLAATGPLLQIAQCLSREVHRSAL